MASRRQVVTFLTAPARSGKSFNEVRNICDVLIPANEGMIYTNLPLYVDRIAEWAAKRYGKEKEEVAARLHVIPREVETGWMNAGKPDYDLKCGRKTGNFPITGPWEYLADKPLGDATIIIDEVHNFCGAVGTPKAVADMWAKWLGELGHNQTVFRCLSQAPEKVHRVIKNEAQSSYTIRNTGLDRDPYYKIELYDWLELWAGVFNKPYRVFVFEQETQKVEGRKKRGERKLHLMGPPYFDFYDSFNKPIATEQAEAAKPFEHEYERHLRKGPVLGRLSLVWWFFRKNFATLVGRTAMMAGLFAILLYMGTGGAGDLTHGLSTRLTAAMRPTAGGKAKAEVLPEKAKNDKYAAAGPALDKPSAPKPTPRPKPGGEKDPVGEAMERARREHEEELKKVLLESAKTSGELAKATGELEKAQAEKEAMSAVVLMTPESIVMRKGQRYGIGEAIRGGQYDGRTLARIDYRRREAFLDDGTLLRLAD